MHRSAVLGPLFVVMIMTGLARAQNIRFPTPTPTPRATASPTPTPEARAQPCPTLSVLAQGGQMIRDGQPVAFTANIAGADQKIVPTILWNISAGTIKSGQGMRRVEVDSTGAGATSEREIKVDLWVGGYAPECVLQASATVKIVAPATKFGEFGEVPSDVVAKNMGDLSRYLSPLPDNLYVIAYAGRKSERGFTIKWLRQIKEELTADAIQPRRIIAIDGGFREEPLFEFWIVPAGAEPPRPTPTLTRAEIMYPTMNAPAKPN